MVAIRRFSSDIKTKIPGNHPGVYAVPIQYPLAIKERASEEQLAQRFNGLPFFLNSQSSVVAMYIEPHGSIEEHSNATNSALFLVTRGRGFVRIGGPGGEEREIQAGDAVLWPAKIDHTVWTEEDSLDAIVIEISTEEQQGV
ncbi:cupin domain-containing protein [Ktedonobacter racemifer]|uniref:Cupin 2 conserved barrel domain protein n=1 Tax=Ktedonobacter racemifer DSM 44963 TaxID=485913 RepID=D6TFH7_KTERA|nr:cupin domain-containing protein [Ktedonobacter racemifer]EFH88657.1 Cupin 2 conserved barrel domain protein [Ktedonobacter racemifer DSM 44963]